MSDEHRTQRADRSTARGGAAMVIAGALLLAVATALHPMSADPNDPLAAFAEYAADTHWGASHFGQFAGVMLLALGMVSFAATFDGAAARFWGRLGQAAAIAVIAVAAALQAVDGVALKHMVDRWSAAPADLKAASFEAAFAVRQIEVGLAGFLSVTTGTAAVLLGIGMTRSELHSQLLGLSGLIVGVGFVGSGIAQLASGFSDIAMTASMTASSAFLVWVIAVGISEWRRQGRPSTSQVNRNQP